MTKKVNETVGTETKKSQKQKTIDALMESLLASIELSEEQKKIAKAVAEKTAVTSNRIGLAKNRIIMLYDACISGDGINCKALSEDSEYIGSAKKISSGGVNANAGSLFRLIANEKGAELAALIKKTCPEVFTDK